MQIHNALPHFLETLARWEKPPGREAFAEYLKPLESWLAPLLEDFTGYRGFEFYEFLHQTFGRDLGAWSAYRARALTLSSIAEEKRARAAIASVERVLGRQLDGEVVLFGALTLMDGYARFDRGKHRVFLGVDEDFANGDYLDILMTHELAHVAREANESVWRDWGLSTEMTHDEFVANYPTLEHLFNEGFACVVSEAAHPDAHVPARPWRYVYQSEDSWRELVTREKLAAIDRRIHSVLRDPSRRYNELYDTSAYGPELPDFAHYTWAWAWAKSLCTGPLPGIVARSSHEWLDHALEFRLEKFLLGDAR